MKGKTIIETIANTRTSCVHYVRGGSGAERDWLFTGMLLIVILRRMNQQFYQTFYVQFVKEVTEDQEALGDTNTYLRKENQCILRYSMEQCSVSGCQHWFKSAGGISVHKFKDCVILLLLPNM